MRGCWSREVWAGEDGRTEAGRTEEREELREVEAAIREGFAVMETEETEREETIFVAVEKEAVETELIVKSHSEPKPTEKPGTSRSIMDDFVSKTKQFYK